jgi:hypothetical protein
MEPSIGLLTINNLSRYVTVCMPKWRVDMRQIGRQSVVPNNPDPKWPQGYVAILASNRRQRRQRFAKPRRGQQHGRQAVPPA